MTKKINFKPYYNDDSYNYDELPQFIVDVNETQYQNTAFKSKSLYFYMYNKYISSFTKKEDNIFSSSFFELTNKEIQEYLNVKSENTAKKYKDELIHKGLIIEKQSKGKKPNSYSINLNIKLSKASSVYTDKEGNKRFTYIKVPRFLKHSYFSNYQQHDIFLYSLIRHRMNLSINSAEKGDRTYVDNNGRVFCLITNKDLGNRLRLNEKLIKDARNRLCATGLLQEDVTYSKDNSHNIKTKLKFYANEPIALPVETQKNNENCKYIFIARTSKYVKNVMFYKQSKNKKEGVGINKNEPTPQKNEVNPSKNVHDTPQNLRTIELELRELINKAVKEHMKHMLKDLNVSNIPNNDKVIHLSNTEIRANKYPKGLAMHIKKQDAKYINSFCDVINKGKCNSNNKLGTNYAIEEVERDLINAVNSAGQFSKSNNKTQKQVEKYLMGAVQNVFEQHHERQYKQNETYNNTKRSQSIEMTPKWLEDKGESETKARRNKSIEMTPKWLEDRDNREVKEEVMSAEDIQKRDNLLQELTRNNKQQCI